MSIKTQLHRIAIAAAIGLATVGAAQAHTISAVTRTGNFIFNAGVPVIPGMVSPLFANLAGQRFIVHFAAECAVNAAAGNTTAWTDVDIQLLNGAGALVAVLQPTVGNLGAFCSADGSAGLSGWQSNAVIAVSPANLPAGNYRVRVLARLNNGATQASYGERTLLVTR
jgi:hypothetical protein